MQQRPSAENCQVVPHLLCYALYTSWDTKIGHTKMRDCSLLASGGRSLVRAVSELVCVPWGVRIHLGWAKLLPVSAAKAPYTAKPLPSRCEAVTEPLQSRCRAVAEPKKIPIFPHDR